MTHVRYDFSDWDREREYRRRRDRFLIGVASALVIIGFIILWLAPKAHAQEKPFMTMPLQTNTANASTTIAVTDTFQQVWAASTTQRGRSGCTIINYGTHTMWVSMAAAGGEDKAASVQLSTGQPFYCNWQGNNVRDRISITGTSGDAFYAAQQ